jgi:hypothetical protein
MHFAAVSFDSRPDVLEHERKQTIEITFPKISPIGHAAIIEFQ